MKFFSLTALLLGVLTSIWAQNSTGKISGSVFDEQEKAVAFANVILYASADSSMSKAEYTDETGQFAIPNIAAGNYWVAITYVGLPAFNSDVIQIKAGEELKLPPFIMASSSTDLDEVVVVAKKPIIEVHPDKTVFNVEGSINATGSNALELLKKSPGVIVDNNDNIILQGKNGVQVYIDGKPSPLSSADLAEFLKSVQSTEIEAIEIITNPSAKYDAEGNAGIINIRLKKDKRLGTNANISLGGAMGEVPKYNGSLNMNYRNKLMNTFGSYSYNGGEWRNFMNFYRRQDKIYDQRSRMRNESNNHNFKLGTDFFINDKSTIGFLVNGFFSKRDWFNDGRTEIASLEDGIVDSVLIAESNNIGDRQNLNFNLNYRFDNGEGVVWNFDGDYGKFHNTAEAYQPNFYKSPNEGEIYSQNIFGNNTPTDIDIVTGKVDHERNLWGGKLGLGVKYSYVTTDNTFDFYNILNGEEIFDPMRSSKFVFKENINAFYSSFQKQIDKLSIQLGFRIENTNSTGTLASEQQIDNKEVDRHYTDFFPSGGVSYQVNQKNMLRLNYSRRIDRPRYQDLNPFENKLDELTYQRGNPFLRPQYTHNVELTHTFNYTLNTSLSYSYTKDYFTQITDTTETSRSFISHQNLSNQEVISLAVSYPFAVTKWWNIYTNATGYYTHNKADFGEGKTVDISVNAFSFYSQHTFSLPYNLSFQLSGFYNSPNIWGGTFENESMWGIDAGLQAKILDGKGTLKLSLSDIFNTMQWHGVSDFGGLYMDASGGWESRRVSLNFSYMLGNEQVKSRKRKTGLEDEKSRVGGDN
ncbi:MAG: TonB-dependent receptor [Saprospiraceae bacterium]|nr:MAG: TonB-dependent receptor [Saprospiraceae bacterium]